MTAEQEAPRKPAGVFHPGEYLAEELRARGWDVATLAAHLSRRGFGMLSAAAYLRDVFMCAAPITPNLAAGLSDVLGTSPDYWLNLQRAYDDREPPP